MYVKSLIWVWLLKGIEDPNSMSGMLNQLMQSEVNPGPVPNIRSDKTSIVTKYRPVPTRTDRFKDSPIPYMTEILNNFYSDE